jgi:hypothetical protein
MSMSLNQTAQPSCSGIIEDIKYSTWPPKESYWGWATLPEEVKDHILNLLFMKELARVSCVSLEFRQVSLISFL